MSTEVQERQSVRPAVGTRSTPPRKKSPYPYWFCLPAAVIFFVFFVVPTFSSFFFSLTRWDLTDWEFIGLDNFIQFFQEPALVMSLKNTLIYAVVTCGLKVVLGILMAQLLTSQIIARGFLRSVAFFPVLVSTIGVGLTFTVLMDPSGAHQQWAGPRRHRGPGLARGPQDRTAFGGAGGRLEGRGAGHGDLHRRDRLDPA